MATKSKSNSNGRAAPVRLTARTATTPPELARRWGVSATKVLAWIRSGELRAFDVATRRGDRPRYLIADAEIEAFTARRAVVPTDDSPLQHVRKRRPQDHDVIQFF